MPFFQGAYDFEINGGSFYDVKGDMNTYKVNNSVNVTGSSNQTTVAPNYSRNDNRSFHYGVNNYNGPTQNYTSGTQQYIHGAHSQTVTSDHNQQSQLAEQFTNMGVREEKGRSDPPNLAHSNDTSPHTPPIRPKDTPQYQPGAQQLYPLHPTYPPHPQYPVHYAPYYAPSHPPHQTGPILDSAMALDGFNKPSPMFHQSGPTWYSPPGALPTFEEHPVQPTQSPRHPPGHMHSPNYPPTPDSPYAFTGSSAWFPNAQGHHDTSPAPPSPPMNVNTAPSPPTYPNPIPIPTSHFPVATPNELLPSNHYPPVFPPIFPTHPPLPMPATKEPMQVPTPSVAPAVFELSPVSSPPPLTSTPSAASSTLHSLQTPGITPVHPKKKKKWYFLGLRKSKKLKVEGAEPGKVSVFTQ